MIYFLVINFICLSLYKYLKPTIMSENNIAVYHEKVKVPLFHICYEVLVSDSMPEIYKFLDHMYPGLNLHNKLASSSTGYTCIVKHPVDGERLLLFLSTEEADGLPSMTRRIAHECTHLSWYIMDVVGLDINSDNHESQAYLMEELVDQVSRIAEYSKEIKNDLSDL